MERCFGQHPDAEIITSQPGLGVVLGARVLAEFGDDPDRYADAKARRNYAGTSPITKASGNPTGRAGPLRPQQATRLTRSTNRPSPRSTPHPAPERSTTTTEPAAPPTTKPCAPSPTASSASSHGCLRHRTNYDEAIAWAHRATLAA